MDVGPIGPIQVGFVVIYWSDAAQVAVTPLTPGRQDVTQVTVLPFTVV